MQLKGIEFKDLLSARIKKLILDMTSLKFESIVFVAYGMWVGKINDYAGLAYMAAAVGIKEYYDNKKNERDATHTDDGAFSEVKK
jgi:hypothetical protein